MEGRENDNMGGGSGDIFNWHGPGRAPVYQLNLGAGSVTSDSNGLGGGDTDNVLGGRVGGSGDGTDLRVGAIPLDDGGEGCSSEDSWVRDWLRPNRGPVDEGEWEDSRELSYSSLVRN